MEEEWLEKSYRKARDLAGDQGRREAMDEARRSGKTILEACLAVIPNANSAASRLWSRQSQAYTQKLALEMILEAVTGRNVDSKDKVELTDEVEIQVVRQLFYHGVCSGRIHVKDVKTGKDLWEHVNRIIKAMLAKDSDFNGGQSNLRHQEYRSDEVIRELTASFKNSLDRSSADAVLKTIASRIDAINEGKIADYEKDLENQKKVFLKEAKAKLLK